MGKEAELINEAEFLKTTLENFEASEKESEGFEALMNNENYIETRKSLAELSKISKEYFTLGEDGEYKKADNETIANMIDQYNKLNSSLNILLSGDKKNDLLEKFKESKSGNIAISLLEHTHELVIKDINALKKLTTDEPVELPRLIVDCRSRRLQVNGPISKSSGNLSERIPVSFTDSKGKLHEGFFTKDVYIDYKKTFRNVFNDKIINASSNYNDVVRAGINKLTKLINDPAIIESPTVLHYTLRHMGSILAKNGNDPVLMEAFKDRYGKDTDKKPLIFKTKKEYVHFVQVMPEDTTRFQNDLNEIGEDITKDKACRPIFKLESSTFLSIKQSYGSSIPQRNSAMSAVAKMLGVENIIAHSENMTVCINGNEYQGVFMEKAEGKDLRKAQPVDGDPFFELCKTEAEAYRNGKKAELFDNKSLIKDINDLHILDYICNNVDRHGHNFMYKFSEDGKKIIGIQGIDNDDSFGTMVYDPNNKPKMNNHAVLLKDIKYINKSMFDTLNNLDKNMLDLTLKGFALSDKERDAVLARVDQVKEAVKNKTLTVLSEEALKTKTIQNIAKETIPQKDNPNATLNLFNRLNIITNTIRSEALNSGSAAPTKFASGKMTKLSDRLTQLDRANIKSDASLFDSLQNRMKATDKKVKLGSKAFEKLENSIEAAKKNAISVGHNMNLSLLGVDAYSLSEYTKSLSDIVEKATKYLKTKPKTSNNMAEAPKERFETARQALKYANERLEGIRQALTDRKELISAENRISFESVQAEAKKLNAQLHNSFDKNKYFKWVVLDEVADRGKNAFNEVSLTKADLKKAIKAVSNNKYIEKALELFEGKLPKAGYLKDVANKCKSVEVFGNSIEKMTAEQAKQAYSILRGRVSPTDNLNELSGGSLKKKIDLELDLEKMKLLKDKMPQINFENTIDQQPQL